MKEFVKQFITKPKETGAVLPSSERLAKMVCDCAQITNKKYIAELGPGTGVFTEEITKHLREDAVFFVVELNKAFVEETQRRCPQVKIFNDSAENLPQYVKEMGLVKLDCVICGLPWANFSSELQEKIMKGIMESLKPGGIFVTFAYLHGKMLPTGIRFRKMLKKNFSHVMATEMLWSNVPPAFVYTATK